jgi:acyl-lipid omega-6 desaturase (Delta-12 desaturase)
MLVDSSAKKNKPQWYYEIKKYEQPSLPKAVLQVLNTFIPYLFLLALMIFTVQHGYSYLVTLALSVAAAGFLVRIFVLFHDCTHNSFFASYQANRILGYIAGILTLTPYDDWQWSHARHHTTAGDLDRDGAGSVWTMTVKQYLAGSKLKRLQYRIFRNPLFLFGVCPTALFFFGNRIWTRGVKNRQRFGVIITDLAALGIVIVASMTIGLRTYVLVQLPVMLIAATIGVWLFNAQHHFEGVYWAHHEQLDRMRVALEGSSYYKLPPVLRWFTANIGIHHLHHVRTHIPNYNLKKCLDNTPALQAVRPLTIRRSLKALWLSLWDEEQQKLISFRELKKL